MKKVLLFGLGLLLGTTLLWAQDRTISGKVTSADDGSLLPGVNILIKGTTIGGVTDVDGNYKISVPQGSETLVFTFIGLETQEVAIGNQSVINVQMESDVKQLSEVVVTALGIERETRTMTYAAQEVKSEELNITQDANIKTALAGKVAGVQINGQAGSKLGSFGKIRIRGAISLTSDNDPLYIVDGVPTPDPNDIDMDNIASLNVLKGPNATALYGQRADAGVVVITTKKGSGKVSVELTSSTTWDKVGYLPKYQNTYGQGYDGEETLGTFDFAGGGYNGNPYPSEWSVFDGKTYIMGAGNNYADESWGPKLDGREYVPWYAWWPDSPYFGKTAKLVPQPDNIKDFYDTGITMKNSVAVSGGNDTFKARLSYTNLNQRGITPYTTLKKNFINSNFEFNATEKFTVSSNVRFTASENVGDYTDGYSNQTTGSFNSWFNRNVDMNIMKELKDLKTPDGYSASWNWWGPDYYVRPGFNNGFRKAAFWFNPYTFMEQYKNIRTNENYVTSITAAYKFDDHWEISATGSRNATEYRYNYYFPFYLANSAAPELYNAWSNSFGNYNRSKAENNYSALLKYTNEFGDFDVSAFVGGNIRKETYKRTSTQMPDDAKSGGLIIPDVYTFSNAGIVPTTNIYNWDKQVNSLYGNASFGYKSMVYLDMSVRKDWSSALPNTNNGYLYPSVGASFIFSEMLTGIDFISFGKLRGGWAQVGNDVDALRINSVYETASQAFEGTNIIMYTPKVAVDPNIKPALNTSLEGGIDLRFINNRVGLSFTYYNEKRKDEIIPVSVSKTTGYNSFLTNAGASSRRGVEISLDADIFKSASGFTWNARLNFAKNKTTVDDLPGELESIDAPGLPINDKGETNSSSSYGFATLIHQLGNSWGQLRGTGYKRDAKGNIVLQPNGLYATEQDMFLGSVLPDFTGGIVNTLSYKGFTLMASIDYQKGGKFFSLSEMWGSSSGLLEPTAATNDKGMNVRDAVDDGGGVHVTGVDESGTPMDVYVEGYDFFTQYYSNRLAEPYIHDASYIKLRDVSLTYDFTQMINSKFIKGATLGVVARNVWRIGVAKDNINRWDPSELSQTYGENGQLPGTRSYGVNLKLTF